MITENENKERLRIHPPTEVGGILLNALEKLCVNPPYEWKVQV